MNPTLYDVLGVPRDASREEIRRAWRDAADRFEPGEGGSTRQFRLFNEAAEVLLDPERRRAYDASLPAEPVEGKADDAQTGPTTAPAEVPARQVPGPPIPGASSAAAAPSAATAAPTKTAASGKAPTSGKTAASEKTAASGKTAALPSSGSATPSGSAAPATVAVPTADAAQEQEGREPAPRRATALLVVLAVLALASVVLAAVLGVRGWNAYQDNRAAAAYQEALDRAPSAAEAAAAAVLSYDYRSLEADRDAAAKFLSEDYRADYVDTFDKLVVDSATQTKAQVEAEVLASAAMNSPQQDPDRVPVLLFVNQTTTSTATAEPSVALNRVRFDMVEVDGTWLVDGITSY